MDISPADPYPDEYMDERMEKEADRDQRPLPPAGERPMRVDYFAVLSTVMAILLLLSQGFALIWLDLL
jgi:hypothetical protein